LKEQTSLKRRKDGDKEAGYVHAFPFAIEHPLSDADRTSSLEAVAFWCYQRDTRIKGPGSSILP
jgi:hypothetical protein